MTVPYKPIEMAAFPAFPADTKRAGLYERVSDDEQGRSRSVDQQADAGREAIRENGWRLTAEYSDPISASRFARKARPGWARLMTDLRARRLDVVVLWESSRGDRKLTGWSEFLDACRDTGTLIHVGTHDRTYDMGIARDWRSMASDGVDSAHESDKISLRSRRGTADAAARGEPYGRIPYGYARTYDPVTRKATQLPCAETAPVVREIITRIAEGHAISQLVTELASRKIPSPTGRPRWARSSVVALVLNGVVYIGKRRHNGGPLLDGNWPAIVDEDVYWKAHSVLSDPARKKQVTARGVGGGIRPGAAKYLLSYVAKCEKCGAPLSVQNRTRATGSVVSLYRCASSKGGCAYAPVDWLDALVTAAVITWSARPGVYELLTAGGDREAISARGEAAAERARLDGFELLAISGTMPAESFARIAAGIEARIAELEARAASLSVPVALRDLLGGNSPASPREAREADLLARWKAMPVATRRSIVSTISAPTLAPSGADPASAFRVTMNWKDAPAA